MKENLETALDLLLIWEGEFSHDPMDPGGATKYGITIGTLKRWRNKEVTVDDVRDLGIDEALDIYRAWYWNECRCDELPSGLDVVVFDSAVNQGAKRSRRLLQEALGVTTDGIIGPKTMQAVHDLVEVRTTIRDFMVYRTIHYANIPTFKRYGKGWLRRVFEFHALALKLSK